MPIKKGRFAQWPAAVPLRISSCFSSPRSGQGAYKYSSWHATPASLHPPASMASQVGQLPPLPPRAGSARTRPCGRLPSRTLRGRAESRDASRLLSAAFLLLLILRHLLLPLTMSFELTTLHSVLMLPGGKPQCRQIRHEWRP